MCAFSVNLPERALAALLLGGLLCCVPCALPARSFAASALSAPHSGLDGGHRHAFGPDGEGRRDPRYALSMPNDAYGNPVVPREPEPPRRRHPRPGQEEVTSSQRLPDLPGHDAGWNFR